MTRSASGPKSANSAATCTTGFRNIVPALVAAVLTALRAYIVAGKPRQPIATFGSYEQWSDLVRSALVWLGEADPNLGRARSETTDPIGTKLRGLLLVWYATFKTAPATCNEAVFKANEKTWDEGKEGRAYPALYEVLSEHFSDRRGELSGRLVSWFLRQQTRRVECGIRLEVVVKYGVRQKWRVAVVDQNELDKALKFFFS